MFYYDNVHAVSSEFIPPATSFKNEKLSPTSGKQLPHNRDKVLYPGVQFTLCTPPAGLAEIIGYNFYAPLRNEEEDRYACSYVIILPTFWLVAMK